LDALDVSLGPEVADASAAAAYRDPPHDALDRALPLVQRVGPQTEPLCRLSRREPPGRALGPDAAQRTHARCGELARRRRRRLLRLVRHVAPSEHRDRNYARAVVRVAGVALGHVISPATAARRRRVLS